MFIDRLARDLFLTGNLEGDWRSTELAKGLLMSTRYQVDNVARYVLESKFVKEEEKWDFEKEIPNVAPLAPHMWFEYNGLAVNEKSSQYYGCLVSIDYDSESNIKAKKYNGANLSEDIRWMLRAEFHEGNNEGRIASTVVYLLSVDKNGQCTGLANLLRGESGEKKEDYNVPEDEKQALHIEFIIALTAICFAHCKGTEIAEHKPSRQVKRQAERKKEPTYSYHTIDIHPSARVLKEEGDIEHNGLAKALHICRGNFAHYTAEKPLFGKYVGTVYRPMHVRGSAENGVVEKDYRVHAK